MSGSNPFTADQIAAIRRYCGYNAYSAYGYILGGNEMATLDTQLASMNSSEVTIVSNFLTELATLESAVDGTSANLDTDQASVWVHNKNELSDRIRQYNWKRRELCAFIPVIPGPGLRQAGSVIRT